MDEYKDMTLTMVVPYLCVAVTATCCNATYYDNPGIRVNYRRQTRVETHGQGSKSPTPSDWRIPEETTISAILIFYQSSNRGDGYCRTGRNPDSPLVGSSLPSDFWPKVRGLSTPSRVSLPSVFLLLGSCQTSILEKNLTNGLHKTDFKMGYKSRVIALSSVLSYPGNSGVLTSKDSIVTQALHADRLSKS
jgi:hypothetical protein